MSFSINTGKESTQAPRPLLLCEFAWKDLSGSTVATLYASTHNGDSASGGWAYGGHDYLPATVDQAIDALASMSADGIDRVPSVTIRLADPAATLFATWERGYGFRGATLTLRLVLHDPSTGDYSTDSAVIFVGRCDAASSDEQNLVVSAQSRLNLSRYMLPTPPIQPNCMWINPTSTAQRAVAGDAGSKYNPCGETRDLTTAPPCNYDRQSCTQLTHFSGVTFDPVVISSGREFISGNTVSWRSPDTSGLKTECWPLWLGGRAWLTVRFLNQRPDGNYTRGEAAVGFGAIEVEKVIVNGVQLFQDAGDYRWAYVNKGDREGHPNPDAMYDGHGDGYPGCTVIQYLAPHATIDPSSEPTIQVLGFREAEAASVIFGTYTYPAPHTDGVIFTLPTILSTVPTITVGGVAQTVGIVTDPGPFQWWWAPGSASVMQAIFGPVIDSDIVVVYAAAYYRGGVTPPSLLSEALHWCGLSDDDLNLTSFTGTNSDICNELIDYIDRDGNPQQQPRYSSAIALREKRSAAEIVRGVRQSINGLLIQDPDGKVMLKLEGPLAEQQSAAVDGSNYNTAVTSKHRDGSAHNGYLAYLFDDSNSWSWKRNSRPISDTPNRVSFPFQDPGQNYAISNFSLVESDDVERVGQELPGTLAVQPEGIASYNHAFRCAKLGLAKIHRGNPANDTSGTDLWEWQTSFRGCRLKPGDIVGGSPARYSLTRQQIRVTEIKPSKNLETLTLKGHSHNDEWYMDARGNAADPAYYTQTHPELGLPSTPTFAVEASALDPTVAQVAGLALVTSENNSTINSGVWEFFYVDPATPLTTLASGLALGAMSVTLTDASGVTDGAYIQIGRELLLCGTPTGGSVPITRAQLGSLEDTASSGDAVHLIVRRPVPVPLPAHFVGSADIAAWTLEVPLPDMRLAAVSGYVTNSFGSSVVSIVCLTDNTDHGLPLTAPAPGGAAGATYQITNATATPTLAGTGTTGDPFVLLAEAQTLDVVATTQAVYLLLPAESAMSGISVTIKVAAGSTYSAWLRMASGDDLEGSGSDYEMATPGAITVTGL